MGPRKKNKDNSKSKVSSQASTPRGDVPKNETVKLKREYSTEVPIEFATKVNFNEDESSFVTFLI
jgi:hypothetical protein